VGVLTPSHLPPPPPPSSALPQIQAQYAHLRVCMDEMGALLRSARPPRIHAEAGSVGAAAALSGGDDLGLYLTRGAGGGGLEASEGAGGGAGGLTAESKGLLLGTGAIQLLSPAEAEFLQRYAALRERHLTTTAFAGMPAEYRRDRLGESDAELFAASLAPDLSCHVLVHVVRPFTVTAEESSGAGGGTVTLSLTAGQDALVAYALVRSAVWEGCATLGRAYESRTAGIVSPAAAGAAAAGSRGGGGDVAASLDY
jgi:hypothetical protein